MEAFYPKVMSHKLGDFLESLAPDTIVEMWVKLCDYNKYDPTAAFDWDDLESMVKNCGHVVGIEVTYDDDPDNLIPYSYPLSNSEIEERIEGYVKGE